MIRYMMVAGLALALSGPASAAPSETEFASRMLERLRAAAPNIEYRVSATDPLVVEMKYDGEWGNAVINLHRIFGYCLTASREDCETASSEFANRIKLPAQEPALAGLRIIVRDRSYFDYILQSVPDEEKRPPYRQIGEDLFAILAFDSPETIALAGRDQLHELGITDSAAWELGRVQTSAILPPLPDDAELAKNAIAFQEYEYLASLLADTDAWSSIAAQVGPDLFVTAVSDYFVLVGVLPDGSDLDNFRQTVRDDCAAQERCISPNVYRFRDGRWMIAD